MTSTRDDTDVLERDDALPRAHQGTRVGGGMRRRAVALGVALLIIAVLGVGWLADGFSVAVPLTSTPSAMTRQVGITTVSLTTHPSPLRAGAVETLLLRVVDTSGAAVVGAKARCLLSMPDMAMSLPAVEATTTGEPGVYACSAQTLDTGAWILALSLTLPTGEAGQTTFPLQVA